MTKMQGLYALPPGVDFAAEVVRGLLDRMSHLPPEALAGVTIYGNSSHTLRAIEAAFHEAGPVLLPRLRLLAEIGEVAKAGDEGCPTLANRLSSLRIGLAAAGLLDDHV